MKDKVYTNTAAFNGEYFTAFGIHSVTAGLYGYKDKDIINVEMTIAEDQTIPPSPQHDKNVNNIDYWGWWDNQDKKFTHIYQKRFLLDMCFPYGIEKTEEAGKGKAYRLNIKETGK